MDVCGSKRKGLALLPPSDLNPFVVEPHTPIPRMDADVELLSSDPDSPPPSRPAIRPSRAIQAASLAAASSNFHPAGSSSSSRRSIYPPPSVPLALPNARPGPSSCTSTNSTAGKGGGVSHRSTGGQNRQAAEQEDEEDESDIEITRTVSSLPHQPPSRPSPPRSTSVLVDPSRVHGPATLSSSTSPEAGTSRGAKGAAGTAPGAGRKKKKSKVLLGEAAERTFRSALVDRQKGFGQLAGLDKEVRFPPLPSLLTRAATRRLPPDPSSLPSKRDPPS